MRYAQSPQLGLLVAQLACSPDWSRGGGQGDRLDLFPEPGVTGRGDDARIPSIVGTLAHPASDRFHVSAMKV